METLKAIGLRTSLKSHISSKKVEPEKVRQVLDAARLAPSAHNGQPWRFIVVDDKETVQKFVDETFNQEVNRVAREAPVIIVVLAKPDESRVIHNREFYPFDLGLAVENMLLAATDLGLVTHMMSNVNSERAVKEFLGVPKEVKFMVAIPLAYPTTPTLEEAARERLSKRTRKDLSEIVHWNRWGNLEKEV